MGERLARHTGKDREKLDRDMAADFYLFGQEIIDYGLADGFWDPAELLKLPREGAQARLKAGGERRKPQARKRPEE
jgi:hypothetical protein